MLYEVKVKHVSITDAGLEKNITEVYITDCEFFAEAEYAAQQLYPQCEVVAIRRSQIKEIVNQADKNEENFFFRIKLIDIFITDSGAEKELAYYQLCAAPDIETARSIAQKNASSYNMRMDAVVKTNILDVIACVPIK